VDKNIIEIHRNYKFRLYPNDDQKILFENYFFARNQAWNFMLALNIKELKQNKHLPKEDKIFTELDDIYKLTKIHLQQRNIDYNSGVVQDELIKLKKAFLEYYKGKKGFPKFKLSHLTEQSFIIRNQATHILDRHLKIFKHKIKAKFHRRIPDHSKFNGGVIKRESDGKYYVFLNLTINHELPNLSDKPKCGIDLNVKNIAISASNGNQELIILEDYSKSKYSKTFKKVQKKLSKRYKNKNFSNKTKKLQNKSNKIQKKIKNKKEDSYHKISKDIVNNHSRITIEDLEITSMKESDKTFLNRIISDVSWGSLINKIKYKAEMQNVFIDEINPAFSSQRCSKCGYISRNNRKSQSDFCCENCSYTCNADLNASKNILDYDHWSLEQKSMLNAKSSQVTSLPNLDSAMNCSIS